MSTIEKISIFLGSGTIQMVICRSGTRALGTLSTRDFAGGSALYFVPQGQVPPYHMNLKSASTRASRKIKWNPLWL